MSPLSIYVDEFMRLTLTQHHQELALYDREIQLLQELLAAPENAEIDSPVSRAAHVAKWQEELENYQKLRDVHQVRIDELSAPVAAAETDGSSLFNQQAA